MRRNPQGPNTVEDSLENQTYRQWIQRALPPLSGYKGKLTALKMDLKGKNTWVPASPMHSGKSEEGGLTWGSPYAGTILDWPGSLPGKNRLHWECCCSWQRHPPNSPAQTQSIFTQNPWVEVRKPRVRFALHQVPAEALLFHILRNPLNNPVTYVITPGLQMGKLKPDKVGYMTSVIQMMCVGEAGDPGFNLRPVRPQTCPNILSHCRKKFLKRLQLCKSSQESQIGLDPLY